MSGEYDFSKPASSMTLQSYFMAHAPAEPQPWFKPAMPPKPITRWMGKIDGEVTEFKSEHDANRAVGKGQWWDLNAQAIADWDLEQAKQRYVQWPKAWADEMLSQRIS